MKPAELPDEEPQRLAALIEYGVLDTLPEPIFDDITMLASQICGTPMALISLIDADRQWFKSRVGVDAQETDRAVAFCAHAILEPDQVMVVEDASTDDRFADNPLVVGDMNVRFYAGAPIKTPKGHALGTVCTLDRQQRQLTPAQLAALRTLAVHTGRLLELRWLSLCG